MSAIPQATYQGLWIPDTVRGDSVPHGEQAAVSDYLVQFGQSTLENWQSEPLQLFSFVVSAVLIHTGSAESKTR